jgi:NAD(P)-dependent dehydrogenase (short-subunit alcohol dehydrogenase family)
MNLDGRVALVTGGSGDLGTAISKALATAGADIAVAYVGNRDGADATCVAVEALGRRHCVVQLDQIDPAANDRAVDEAATRMGRLDILVNNAAWNIGVPFKDLDGVTLEIWDRIFDTNVRGPFQLSRAAARHMRKQGGGRIVNIASIAGVRPSGSSIPYATSKAALIHLTRCLAVALAPDITVNCVAPGLVEGTRMAARIPPEVVEWARRTAVLGRAASPEDIARQVVTFCQADSVTGQVLTIDGGVAF